MVSERARFDSEWRLHSSSLMVARCASVAEWQGTRLQSALRGFDSRLMLDGMHDGSHDGSIDGSDPGLLNLAAGFDSLASFSGGNIASVRGRDPSFRSSESWFESSQRHRARVVQWSGRRSFNASKRVRSPSRVLILEGEVCVVQTPVPKTGWRASVRVQLLLLPPCRDLPRLEDDLAVARAPFATRMGPHRLWFDSAVFRDCIDQ